MKRKILSYVAIAALTVVGVFTYTTVSAKINPDCINGCVAGGGGCHCFIDYPQYAEAVWPE